VTGVFVAAQLAPGAAAAEGMAASLEPVQGSAVQGQAPALVDHFTVPEQPEGFQGPQDAVGATGHDPQGIPILDPHEPLAAVGPRIEVAPDGCEQRAKM